MIRCVKQQDSFISLSSLLAILCPIFTDLQPFSLDYIDGFFWIILYTWRRRLDRFDDIRVLCGCLQMLFILEPLISVGLYIFRYS